MTTFVKYLTAAALAVLSLMSCSSETSLQEYLVAKQDDAKFIKIDLPTSMLDSKENDLDKEQREVLASVKKVNVVAYQKKDDNVAEYEAEKAQIKTILNKEEYKLLSKVKSGDMNMTLKYTGDDDAIDEVIVLASSEERGFAVFRLLGKNMRPEKIMELMSSVNTSDMDTGQLKGVLDMLKM